MKRKRFLLLLVALLLSLAACGGYSNESIYTVEEISHQIIESQEDLHHLEMLSMGDDGFPDFLYAYYALEVEMLEDGVICFPDHGADAREIMVLQLKEEVDQQDVEERLAGYIELRTASYRGYMPEQVLLLEQALVESRGLYVALFVCDNPTKASKAFTDCIQ